VEDTALSLILRSWSWRPTILLSLGLVAAVYAYVFYDFRRRGRLVKASQAWYFGAGLLTLFVALLSPIDTFSNVLFVMHMTQHILLVMVAPPLILLGLPASFLSPLIRNPRVKDALTWLTHPVMAFTLYNAVLITWHLPALYEAALQNERLHNLEHALFFYTALLSWWPLLSPLPELPRLSYPAQMLYIFLIAIPAGLLGAVLIFAEGVLYPTYAAAPRLLDLSPLADQRTGALIMMIPP
jgi:putative membrane protein